MLNNSKNWPQVYSCKFLTAGLVSYEDSGAGIALLKKETIDKMLPSFIGKPVLMEHHDVDAENYQEFRKGNVIKCWFCPDDGWFYADFLVEDDAAVKCIEEDGYSVSCAYNVLDAIEGGTYQDIKYDGEITEGSFTHLALVESPRYEESKIMKQSPMMLVNSKQAHYVKPDQEDKSMFTIFKKNAKGEKEMYTGMVVNIDGNEMPVDALIKNYQDVTAKEAEELKKKEDAKKNAKTVMNSTDIIDINGNKVSIGEMVEKVKGAMPNSKTNAKEDEEKAKEEEAKKNAKEAEEKAAAEAKAKENAKSEDEKKAEEEAKAKENAKAEEEAKAKENAKAEEEKAKAEADAKSKENSKLKGDEFFAELHNAKTLDTEDSATILPRSRKERALAWKTRNSK